MPVNDLFQAALKCFRAGELQKAADGFREVLQSEPNKSEALHYLGVICYQLGDYDSAMQYLEKTLEYGPANADVYYNLGAVLQEMNLPDKAILYYEKALQSDPGLADAYNGLGTVYQQGKRIDEAIAYYQKALRLNPGLADTYDNLGFMLHRKGHYDEAVAFYQKALQLNPDLLHVKQNIEVAFRDKKQFMEDKLRNPDMDPGLADAFYKQGTDHEDKGQLDEAAASFKKALYFNPSYAATDRLFHLAYLISLNGDLMKGWGLYWEINDSYWLERFPDKPLWNGEDIRGRTLLIHSDGGYGDTIQFIRYAPFIAESGVKLILSCHRELAPLLKNMGCLQQVITDLKPSGFDLFCPVRRLPLVFRTTLETIPSGIPYVSADPPFIQRWKEIFQAAGSGLKVGLVWKAGHGDRNRSCPLDYFSPCGQLRGITFYSLQIGDGASDAKNPPEGMTLLDITPEIHDFSDTAALIENLDLVISVDTATAHLAGALGKPVWTLLPFTVDSRWLLKREDSPWYPTMRLFRQPSPGDWKMVMSSVAGELEKLL